MYQEDLYIKARRLCFCTESALDKRLYEDGLTTSQCYLLYYIWTHHREGTFTTNLHKELGVSKATISGILKRLRKKGYLDVETCAADERQKKLIPTSKLEMVSNRLEAAIRMTENVIYEKLSEQEKNMLRMLEQKALEQSVPERKNPEKGAPERKTPEKREPEWKVPEEDASEQENAG